MNRLIKPGNRYKNFELKRIIQLPEIQCVLKELTHLPSGAQVMHLENDDVENVFCLSFQTIPENSNGVAHILEHTVLCGSKKYPVKDPFFAMTRRSLNTFMNAFTGADFTCYPAATQVTKDFYNLLDVYMDAVFKPNLKELSFLQEGHRLEFENPEDPNSSLEFKGIVFNEMKGAMATPDSRLSDAFDAALFPDVTYGVNSGGSPKEIPHLTYQQLLDFHRKFYHPSRCLFFFYGNLPLEGHLDYIEERALKDIDTPPPPLPKISNQTRFKKKSHKEVEYPFPADEETKGKTLISFGWLTCHILEQEALLALSILSIVLLGTDAAPLKKALLKSKMCKQVSAHLVDDCNEIPVVITLRGCDVENTEKLEALIFKTLREIVDKGVPKELIENAIHQVEISRCEILGDNLPYGLTLFMRAGLLKQHGGKPEEALLIHSLFQKLRQEIAEFPRYMEILLQKYLLDNPHFVSCTAKPSKDLAVVEIKEEQLILAEIRKKLDEKKVHEIIEKAKKLEEFQEEQENADTDILPKVTLKDVPPKSREYPLTQEKVGSLNVYHHDCFTNQMIYADLVFPLPAIEEKDLSLLKLFTVLLPQMGCGGRTYAENLDYIQAHTGGVGASETINIQAHDYNEFHPYFVLEGKALYRNAEKLFSILYSMATSTDFKDRERIKEVITKHFTGIQNSLNQNALRYAISLASSGLSKASRIGYAWSGLEYYYYVKQIIENFDEKIDALTDQLETLKTRVLCLQNTDLVITCDKEMYEKAKKHSFWDLHKLEERPYTPWNNNFSMSEVPLQGRVIASPVAFTTKIFKTLPYIHVDTPALNIAAQLFDNLILHPRIREQGGAYGGGATNNSLSGNFCFYAYRDPNISSTFAAFDEAVARILTGQFKDSDLEEAKLEIIQGMDSPISPGSRGFVAYSWLREGKTSSVRQKFRDRLLKLEREDIVDAIKKHIQPVCASGNTVVFAGRELLEKENSLLISQGKNPLKIEKI